MLGALITRDLPKFTGIKVPVVPPALEEEEAPPRGRVIKATPHL